MSWSPKPSSRQRSAAQAFSVKKESGPASIKQSSARSVRTTPPKLGPDSSNTYSSCAPCFLRCSSLKAADSPEIPPPMIATLFMRDLSHLPGGAQARIGNRFQCGSQKRGIVERFCSPQVYSFTFCELFEDDINVVKHFYVIAKKPDGLDKNATMSASLEIKNGRFDGWPQPRTSRHSLALKSESPVRSFNPCCSRDQFRRLARLLFIRIALEDGALRNTMRGENYGDGRSRIAISFAPACYQFVSEGLNQ